jgi:hypothetical protein
MYLGSTGLDSGAGLPSASTVLSSRQKLSQLHRSAPIRSYPVLAAPSTRPDHPLILSYQRGAAAPYGSAYQPPERLGDPAAWILCLRKVRAMAISSRRAWLSTACTPCNRRRDLRLNGVSVAQTKRPVRSRERWPARAIRRCWQISPESKLLLRFSRSPEMGRIREFAMLFPQRPESSSSRRAAGSTPWHPTTPQQDCRRGVTMSASLLSEGTGSRPHNRVRPACALSARSGSPDRSWLSTLPGREQVLRLACRAQLGASHPGSIRSERQREADA